MSPRQQLFLKHLALTHPNPSLLEIRDAKGVYLYDVGGKRYTDLNSGIGPAALGHGHPDIIRAVQHQIEQYAHTMVYGEYVQAPQVELASLLTSHLPDTLDTVYFVNSGSEAVEGAIKLARKHTGRAEIISASNAYHGSTIAAESLRSDIEFTMHYQPMVPGFRHIRFNREEDLVKITEYTAAVLLETIQAEAGLILPHTEYLKKLKARCHKTGTLLILDEIQVGLGRTGKFSAFEHYGIVPDIVLLAKALGGGLPLGAFVAGRTLMQSLWSAPSHGHLTTFGGNPVSCAAGLAAIKVLTRPGFLEDVSSKGQLMKSLLEGGKGIQALRSKGMMIAVDMGDKTTNTAVIHRLFEKGYIVDYLLFNDTSFRIAPPLTITEEQLQNALSVVRETIEEVVGK